MENLPIEQERDLTIRREPSAVLAEAQKAAKALGDVIKGKKKPVIINNEQYLEYEDWMVVARFYGITAKIVSTAPITFGDVQGFEARAVALLVGTGEEISAAEAMCLNDEANWKGRPLFMLRSMAQTRAAAKALRNVLAWVVVLAGYKPTPAEEMEGLNGKSSLKEPQKKITPDGLPIVTTRIKDVTTTSGKKQDGTPWMLYVILTENDEKYSTFSKSMGEAARKFKLNNTPCTVTYEATEKGKNLKEIVEHIEDGNVQD